MMSLVIKIVVNAVALGVATWLIDGVDLAGGSTAGKAGTLVVVAVIFGLVNTVIKPIVKVLAFPAYILTLGLFTFIVNAFLLWLTGLISSGVGLDFEVHPFFWAAVLGALVVTIVSFLLHVLIPGDD